MASKRLKSSLSLVSSSICNQCRTATSPAVRQGRMLTTEATSSAPTPADNYVVSHITPGLNSTPSTHIQPPRTLVNKSRQQILTPRDNAGHPPNPFLREAQVTLYNFPDYAPVATKSYPGSHLLLPLRRDILHRAVIYEGDMTRQGTANTKTRWEVHGSNRKVRPQKGTGRARLGDKKNPMLRGGGVAFGPKPRSFASDLPKKVYDLAWRTALSYRYRRGELVVLDGQAEIEREGPGAARWITEMLRWNNLGSADGGSLIITADKRTNLWEAMGRDDKDVEKAVRRHGRCLNVDEVDVKDLLELGRVVVEQEALDKIFREHSADLSTNVKILPHLR
ncbi:ribosomal protein L4 [Myriangium duriaei CBS 260.36]|uniref:Large ribosomal subunit protein uL4m n=1 Tax=Myriangium duriaei CBS 260.36 TaxID=1168546 RepID=A0A9P4MC88_9PEZI|nr:ribosomal protein L4 [Myriangium duriaei CBS 260.36]